MERFIKCLKKINNALVERFISSLVFHYTIKHIACQYPFYHFIFMHIYLFIFSSVTITASFGSFLAINSFYYGIFYMTSTALSAV